MRAPHTAAAFFFTDFILHFHSRIHDFQLTGGRGGGCFQRGEGGEKPTISLRSISDRPVQQANVTLAKQASVFAKFTSMASFRSVCLPKEPTTGAFRCIISFPVSVQDLFHSLTSSSDLCQLFLCVIGIICTRQKAKAVQSKPELNKQQQQQKLNTPSAVGKEPSTEI